MRDTSSPRSCATIAIIHSSASAQSSGDERATNGSLEGRTPRFVP